jgi:hypothetical protein
MNFFLSIYPVIISIFFIFELILGVFSYIYREKHVAAFLKLPDANRERLIKAYKNSAKALKAALWLSPIYLLLIPATFVYFLRDRFIVSVICTVLFVIIILYEYLYRKWLINRLESKDQALSTHTKLT